MIAIKKVLFGDTYVAIELMHFHRFRSNTEKREIEEKIKRIIEKYFGLDMENRKIIFSKLNDKQAKIFYKIIE